MSILSLLSGNAFLVQNLTLYILKILLTRAQPLLSLLVLLDLYSAHSLPRNGHPCVSQVWQGLLNEKPCYTAKEREILGGILFLKRKVTRACSHSQQYFGVLLTGKSSCCWVTLKWLLRRLFYIWTDWKQTQSFHFSRKKHTADISIKHLPFRDSPGGQGSELLSIPPALFPACMSI